ncbi:hypothetical protein FORC065_1352 [Yersinia enterocolitica]|nr:hypothetical protein FORC065_1352 [Yersinia enterocolitica]
MSLRIHRQQESVNPQQINQQWINQQLLRLLVERQAVTI